MIKKIALTLLIISSFALASCMEGKIKVKVKKTGGKDGLVKTKDSSYQYKIFIDKSNETKKLKKKTISDKKMVLMMLHSLEKINSN